MSLPNPILFKNLAIQGELALRAGLNMTRLEGEWYRPDEVFTADTHGWPGDWEGRIILALTLLAQATHREPAYLDEIIGKLPGFLNKEGYLGPVHPKGVADEQQLSGHSWLLRGLIEYANWRDVHRVRPIIEDIAEKLFLKTLGLYRNYPTDPETRHQDPHWVLSRLQTKTKAHAETSDCGCAFIPLDGVTAAYEFLGWPALKDLAWEMIERFRSLDLVGLRVQTHATLSGIRGIIRLYELEGDSELLELACRLFTQYKEEAWTEAFGNYNWFDHPRWTEPCGIIDSFMIATQIWRHTGDPAFLTDAHYIYYNALCHGNRLNGSFGTDRCVGALKADAREFMTPINFETYWCCSMRGGEGFARAIEYGYWTAGDSILVPFYHPGKALVELGSGSLVLRQSSTYPYAGKVRIEIPEVTFTKEASLRLFVPSFASATPSTTFNGCLEKAEIKDGFVTIRKSFKPGDQVEIDLDLKPYTRGMDNRRNSVSNAYKFMFGPMVLGIPLETERGKSEPDISEEGSDRKLIDFDSVIPPTRFLDRTSLLVPDGRGDFSVSGTDLQLKCLCDVKDLTRETSIKQVIFQEPGSCKESDGH
jgi:hypothetical protein